MEAYKINYKYTVMKEGSFILLCIFCLLMCTACTKKPDEVALRLTEESAESMGDDQGFKDGSSGLVYMSGYNDNWTFHASESENKILQEYHSKGYKRGYDRGFRRGKSYYDSKQKAELAKRQELARQQELARKLEEEYERVRESETSDISPNNDGAYSYYHPDLSGGSLHSQEKIYSSRFSNYEETSNCVEGVVVYEGKGGCFIVETLMGYTVLEVYSGILNEGDRVRGELNQYLFKYIT